MLFRQNISDEHIQDLQEQLRKSIADREVELKTNMEENYKLQLEIEKIKENLHSKEREICHLESESK